MDSSIVYLAICLIISGYLFDTVVSEDDCNGVQPCVPLPYANARFTHCCDAIKLGSCAKHCKYDASLKEMKAAVTNGDCQLSDIRNFLRCASNNRNNEACCQKTKVLDDDRNICEPFCNPKSDSYPTSTLELIKYMKCLSQFDQIMQCHYASCR